MCRTTINKPCIPTAEERRALATLVEKEWACFATYDYNQRQHSSGLHVAHFIRDTHREFPVRFKGKAAACFCSPADGVGETLAGSGSGRRAACQLAASRLLSDFSDGYAIETYLRRCEAAAGIEGRQATGEPEDWPQLSGGGGENDGLNMLVTLIVDGGAGEGQLGPHCDKVQVQQHHSLYLFAGEIGASASTSQPTATIHQGPAADSCRPVAVLRPWHVGVADVTQYHYVTRERPAGCTGHLTSLITRRLAQVT